MTQDTSVLSQLISSNSGCQMWGSLSGCGQDCPPHNRLSIFRRATTRYGLTVSTVNACHFRSSEPVRKLSSNGPAFRDTLRIDERKLDFDNYRYAKPGRFVH